MINSSFSERSPRPEAARSACMSRVLCFSSDPNPSFHSTPFTPHQATVMFRPSLPLLKRSVWKGPSPRSPASVISPTNTPPPGPNLVALSGLPKTTPPPPGFPAIRTRARSATILPNFVGLKFAVHNGKIYQEIFITEEMVGNKLGEYVPTRKRFTYKQSKNK